jgi:hypothetical protein
MKKIGNLMMLVFALLMTTKQMMCQESKQKQSNLRQNVEMILEGLGCKNDLTIIGYTADKKAVIAVAAAPEDIFWQKLQNHEEWKKDSWFFRLMHITCFASYRQKKRPSMYVVVFQDRTKEKNRYYEIHIDRFFASLKKPWNGFAHLIAEVMPHEVFRTRTSQKAVQQAIERQKERAIKKKEYIAQKSKQKTPP